MKTFVLHPTIEMANIIEIELTRACNLKCYHCNRRCRQLPGIDEITDDALDRFILRCQDHRWDIIRLLGGEPTLYSNLDQLFDRLKPLYDDGITIEIWSNGYLDSIDRLERLPAWVKIVNTGKKTPAVWDHIRCDLAPRDFGLLIDEDDFCYTKRSYRFFGGVSEKSCGFVYTNGGYYVCGSGSAIDKAFNLGLGYWTIDDLINDLGLRQYNVLCQYCGEAGAMVEFRKTNQLTEWASPTWQKRFEVGK